MFSTVAFGTTERSRQGTLTLGGGSITVQPVSRLTGLDLVAALNTSKNIYSFSIESNQVKLDPSQLVLIHLTMLASFLWSGAGIPLRQIEHPSLV